MFLKDNVLSEIDLDLKQPPTDMSSDNIEGRSIENYSLLQKGWQIIVVKKTLIRGSII